MPMIRADGTMFRRWRFARAEKESGHGQQSVVPLAPLAPQLPAHRAGQSPLAPHGQLLCDGDVDNAPSVTCPATFGRVLFRQGQAPVPVYGRKSRQHDWSDLSLRMSLKMSKFAI